MSVCVCACVCVCVCLFVCLLACLFVCLFEMLEMFVCLVWLGFALFGLVVRLFVCLLACTCVRACAFCLLLLMFLLFQRRCRRLNVYSCGNVTALHCSQDPTS